MSANRSDPNADDPSPVRRADESFGGARRRDLAVFGFALAFAILLVGGVLGYVNATRLDANRRQIAHAREGIAALETLLSTLKDAETGQRGYLLAEDEKYLAPYEDALRRVESDLRKIDELAQDDPNQRDRLADLHAKIEAKLDELAETVALAASGDHAGAVEIVRSDVGRASMDAVREEVAELQNSRHELLRQRDAESRHSYRMTVGSIATTASLALLLMCLSTFLTWRNLREKQTAALLLAEQKERLRTTLASIGDGVISADRDGKVTYLNGVAADLTGWSTADAAGLPLTQVFNIVNETSRKPVENPALRALREGVIVGLANHTILIAKDGAERPIDDSAAPIRCAAGEVVGCVLVFRDITERRQVERDVAERVRLVALRADVSSALASSQPPSVVLNQCCEALVRHLDMAFARIWTLNAAEQLLEMQASAGIYTHIDGPHGRVPVGMFKIGRIAANDEPHLTNDVTNDPNVSDRDWAAREGMVSFAGYPMRAGARVNGVVAMFSRQPLTESVLADLNPLAEAIAQYVERTEAEQRVRETSELYRVTLASIGDAVITTDTEGGVVDMNPVAETLTGWSTADAQGIALDVVFRIVNETTRQPVANPAARALQQGAIVGLANHTILIAKDGTERPIDDSAAPIRNADGQVVGCVLVFRDISERKRAEEEREAAHRQVATTLESIADGFYSVDSEWRFAYVNQEAGRLLGREAGELLGKSLWDVYPQLRETEFEGAYRRVGASGIAESFTAFDPTFSCWFDVSVYPATNGLSVYFRDASERIQAEKTLREREEFSRSLMDGSPDCVKVLDLEGRLSHMNGPGMCAMEIDDFGPFCGQTWTSLWPTESRTDIESALASALAGKPYQFQAFCPTAKGTPRWWEVDVSPVRNAADGPIVRLLAVSRDVTERRQAEEALRASEERLRELAAALSEADHRKDEFLATLAHELRNPLAPIRNGLQLLQLVGDDAETAGQAVTMMDRQVTQLVRLVDDLMDVSRINQGKLALRNERLDLATVVRSAVETSRPLIDEMNHELTVALPERSVWVTGDLTRLSQALMNLLNNAAKYSERGGKIRLIVESREGQAVVSVQDEGIGIAADQLPCVFDIFSQVDRSLERSQGGLGIGLSLVKRIIEMHGGTIEARSEGEGYGSEFVVRLPLAEDATAGGSPDAREARAEGSRLRILVVDDNQDSADSLAKLLRAMGHEALVAYDGERAVEMAAASRVDVILLDIGLPKLNGYEACSQIRRQPGGDEPFIIAQTGWGQAEDRRRTQESGFDRHLVKPIDPTELKKALADAPQRRSS